ncbi:hypothetical protein [Streptacidiphilus monticola]|jgi:hypothetical protein|uniref:Uncharacterized protein n=1 Tax=Streptacidiphilus monticola TaxID=2161674 RepID=A0ABW1GCJ7_9ACTN
MDEPEFRPTHVVPPDGLPSWSAPDPAQPSVPLDPVLPVRLTEVIGDWGHVTCSNGWQTWVDSRLLVALPQQPPRTPNALAPAGDPRPLLRRVEEAVQAYRQALDDLAEGRISREAFADRIRGHRVGAVLDGESAWLLDLEQECWFYARAGQLQPHAAVSIPGEREGRQSAVDHAPTQAGEP